MIPDATTIRELATRLAALSPRDSSQVALVGFMAGALYALERAVHCGFDDARMKLPLDVERSEQKHAIADLERGLPPGNPWLAGFYLDSAILRLSALNERLDKHLDTKHDTAYEIRRLVNQIKHEVDAGIGQGWSLTFAGVLKSTEELCRLLEQAAV